jgi:hypothetical protein
MGGVNMNGKFLSNVAGFFSAGSPGVRAGTDACRYLAAAAYHDGAFRDSVLSFSVTAGIEHLRLSSALTRRLFTSTAAMRIYES